MAFVKLVTSTPAVKFYCLCATPLPNGHYLGLAAGTVWRCDTCGRQWTWDDLYLRWGLDHTPVARPYPYANEVGT